MRESSCDHARRRALDLGSDKYLPSQNLGVMFPELGEPVATYQAA